MRARWMLVAGLAWGLVPGLPLELAGTGVARAEGTCHTLAIDLLPAASPHPDPGLRFPLQIVAWLEDATGTYVETAFITQAVGTYGLGNRPGRYDFNSGPGWPYGRRITVFPVWAHRHGLLFPEIVFQSGSDSNLSHMLDESSREPHYCAPLERSQAAWDTGTCASVAYTDKGRFSDRVTGYPPRQDLLFDPSRDAADVAMYALLNPFDSVSRATPPSGERAVLAWPAPPGLPLGDYVLWLEVAREFDHNATYSTSAYPAPSGIPWEAFGMPYRGQPSVLYRVPITLADAETQGTTRDYAGYGDPDGLDGAIRAPDATITTDVPGSGAARLAIVPGGDYRVRVTARPEDDPGPPAAPAHVAAETTHRAATLSFIAPGDDGLLGRVARYEVRYVLGRDLAVEEFAGAVEVELDAALAIVGPGERQMITIDKLLPESTYGIGIRAIDNCGNAGPVSTLSVTTAPRPIGEVDACFVATAAYGSLLAADLEPLRRLRDAVHAHSVLGELAVETYYTFSPALAGAIAESELFRATARAALAPLVHRLRDPGARP